MSVQCLTTTGKEFHSLWASFFVLLDNSERVHWPPEEVARARKTRETQVKLIKQEQEHTAQGGEKNRRRA